MGVNPQGVAVNKIVARCDECGQDQKLPAVMYELFRCHRDGSRDYYTFTCGLCCGVNVKRVNVEIVALLIGAGATVTPYRLPDEVLDSRRSDDGRIDTDFLLDFINALSAWDGKVPA